MGMNVLVKLDSAHYHYITLIIIILLTEFPGFTFNYNQTFEMILTIFPFELIFIILLYAFACDL